VGQQQKRKVACCQDKRTGRFTSLTVRENALGDLQSLTLAGNALGDLQLGPENQQEDMATH
jgi:hypothetical protein